MKRVRILLGGIALVWLVFVPPAAGQTWDLANYECDSIATEPAPVYPGVWHYANSGSGTSVAVTEDGRSCIRLSNPGGASDKANVQHHWLTWAGNCTVEIVFKINDLLDAAYSGSDMELFIKDSNDRSVSLWFSINSSSSVCPGFYLSDWGPVHRASVDVDINTTKWVTLRLVVSGNDAYVYVDGHFYAGPIHCAETVTFSGFPGWLKLEAWNTGNGKTRIVYVDRIRMSSTPKHPEQVRDLSIQGVNVVTRMAQIHSGGVWIGPSKLRYRKTNCHFAADLNYEIPLVETTDPLASALRIYDGASVKACMKYPTF